MTAADIQQDQDFVITRTLNAPREKVWRAYSDTEPARAMVGTERLYHPRHQA